MEGRSRNLSTQAALRTTTSSNHELNHTYGLSRSDRASHPLRFESWLSDTISQIEVFRSNHACHAGTLQVERQQMCKCRLVSMRPGLQPDAAKGGSGSQPRKFCEEVHETAAWGALSTDPLPVVQTCGIRQGYDSPARPQRRGDISGPQWSPQARCLIREPSRGPLGKGAERVRSDVALRQLAADKR